MIRHIVVWKLKDVADGQSKEINAKKAKDLLEACAGAVPGMLRYEVGIADPGGESTYDLVLYSEFENMEALAAYTTHPLHQALKPFFATVREARQCVDYIV